MSHPITSNDVFHNTFKGRFARLAAELLKDESLFRRDKGRGEKGNTSAGAGKEDRIKPKSLEIYLKALDNGTKTWWEQPNRRKEVNALAQILDVDPEDLGVHGEKWELFRFRAFPGLRPLEFVRGERGWHIGHARDMNPSEQFTTGARRRFGSANLHCWFADTPQHFGMRPLDWLVVDDALELAMLGWRVAVNLREPTLEWKSVGHALRDDANRLRVLDPAPLALMVAAPTDFDALLDLIEMRRDAPLLVITSHPLPPSPHNRTHESGAQQPAGRHGTLSAATYHWHWVMPTGWRELLVDWVGARNGKTRALPSALIKSILQETDSACSVFRTSSDVLALCDLVFARQEKLTDRVTATNAAQQLLDRLCRRDYGLYKSLRQAVKARWEALRAPWDTPLTVAQWQQIANESRTWECWEKDGVFVQSNGMVTYRQPLVASLVAQTILHDHIVKGSVMTWALACFDAQRRLLVDRALDLLSYKVLEAVAHKVLAASDSHLTLGAQEAIFAAVGRRMMEPAKNCDEFRLNAYALKPVWNSLAQSVLRRLEWREGRGSAWTRPMDTAGEEIEWAGVCWAWSLLPVANLQLPASWQFPGWGTGEPGSVCPEWLTTLLMRHEDEFYSTPSRAWTQFFHVLQRWRASAPGKASLASPRPLAPLPAMFHLANAVGASAYNGADEVVWGALFHRPWAVQVLIKSLDQYDEARQVTVAQTWWPSLVSHQRGVLQGRYAPVSDSWDRGTDAQSTEILQWVAPRVTRSPVQAWEALDNDQKQFLATHASGLAAPMKKEILSWLAGGDNFPNLTAVTSGIIGYAWILLLNFGEDMVQEVRPLLTSFSAEIVAQLVWQWDAEVVQAWMLDVDATSMQARQVLLRTCPRDRLPAAIDAIERFPDLLPGPALAKWVRENLRHAGADAPRLLTLLKPLDVRG